jgi:hypothetical protein
MNALTLAASAIGVLSALLYMTRRRWLEALLALIASVALAGAVGDFTLPGAAGTMLAISSDQPPSTLDGVDKLRLEGDGLRAAQWRDLPARPLQWTAPSTKVVDLDFPREIALGRMFTLTLRPSWQAPGRLQLLAENGQVLAEAKGSGPLSVQWLPPLAESLVLRARLLDADGKVVDQGPLPLRVSAPLPLQVRGRFGAPSFDLRALDELLANSNASIDWQVELGKGLSRSELPRAEAKVSEAKVSDAKVSDAKVSGTQEPDLEIVDAAWFERAGASARSALLSNVAAGRALLVLGANAADVGLWSRSLGLALRPQPANKTLGTALPMASAGLNPDRAADGAWSGADGIWTRDWQGGRIAWIGVGDWHRHAISEPRALALWWQAALDRLRVRRKQELAWLDPDEMPLPRQRLALCARGDGLAGAGALVVPALGQRLAWQGRADSVDAACVAVWPASAGWLRMHTEGKDAAEHALYVHDDKDWPLWQRAQRRAATREYAARLPAAASKGTTRLPVWPFGLAFAAAMLALWWRERR